MPQTASRERIAENVRAAKARRRVTDADIADVIGVSRSAANDRINGNANFRIHELQLLAVFLDTPFEQLIAPAAEVAEGSELSA